VAVVLQRFTVTVRLYYVGAYVRAGFSPGDNVLEAVQEMLAVLSVGQAD